MIRRQSPSPEQVLEMARHYEQGESLARVGARVGFDAGSVRTLLRRAGVSIRDAHGRRWCPAYVAGISAMTGMWSCVAIGV